MRSRVIDLGIRGVEVIYSPLEAYPKAGYVIGFLSFLTAVFYKYIYEIEPLSLEAVFTAFLVAVGLYALWGAGIATESGFTWAGISATIGMATLALLVIFGRPYPDEITLLRPYWAIGASAFVVSLYGLAGNLAVGFLFGAVDVYFEWFRSEVSD